MCRKKCKLLNEKNEFYNDGKIDENLYHRQWLEYTAQIEFPLIGILEIKSNVELDIASLTFTNVNLYLYHPFEDYPAQAIISEYNKKTQEILLKQIFVPLYLRRCGLGELIFKIWLKIIYQFSCEYGWSVSKIWGNIGHGDIYTPKISKKLYRKMHNYKYDDDRYLQLNKREFKTHRIEYTFSNKKSLYLF